MRSGAGILPAAIILLIAAFGAAIADPAASTAPAANTTPAPAAPATPASPTAPAAPAAPSALTPSVANIPIGPYDVLHLDVLGQPDLTKDYIVDGDGDINVAYVGKIRVGGLTTDQAEGVVTDRLKKFYKNVSLNLTRTAIGGISVTITGQVTRTGPISVRRDARLNDVIQTLGPTAEADLSKIQITRGLPGAEHTTIGADLMSYLNSNVEAGNPLLKDGDVIFVPMKVVPKLITMAVSVVGSVPRPGVFTINPGTTVYDVVTMAGSLNTDADPKGIYVQPANSPTIRIPLDWTKLAANPGDSTLNPIVADGDKIVVPTQTVTTHFSITGAVRNPNTYPLSGQLSLLNAVAMAGGLVDGAKPSECKITRLDGTGKKATTTKFNLNDSAAAALYQIQPDDNIEIPMSSHHGPGMSPFEIIGGITAIVTLFKLFH